MDGVIARRGSEVEWHSSRHAIVEGKPQSVLRSKLYLNPAKDPAMLRLVEYSPGYSEPRHRHTAAEIVYIIAGEVDIDGVAYREGDVLWIGANEEYGPLTAGAAGMTFLLVRQKAADLIPS